jgi:hypothetical protein
MSIAHRYARSADLRGQFTDCHEAEEFVIVYRPQGSQHVLAHSQFTMMPIEASTSTTRAMATQRPI